MYITVVCKIKYLFSYTWKTLAIWYLLLACIDRFLHSSSNINMRRWSSYKVAYRVIPITFILVHLAYFHVLIFYDILLPQRSCSIENVAYNIFLGIWHLVTYGSGPPLLMLLFSIFTIRHIRHRAVMPITIRNSSSQGHRRSNKSRNLIRMTFVQCLVVGSTITVYAISQWYISLTSHQTKTNLQIARENLFFVLSGIIAGVGHNITFFIFTLTSRLFREQLFCR
ncbi:hypothetical protein I4U23_003673 [Adineta vaga]|nr:hypothetical protein I4U23_003673 [Adineta vaga]